MFTVCWCILNIVYSYFNQLSLLYFSEFPLLWKKAPITEAEEGVRLPPFIVQSAGNSDLLEVVVKGKPFLFFIQCSEYVSRLKQQMF